MPLKTRIRTKAVNTAPASTKPGAYRLLAVLLYGQFRDITYHYTGVQYIPSIARLGRTLGTESSNVRNWLEYLESLGYLDRLEISEDRRQASLRVRKPRI